VKVQVIALEGQIRDVLTAQLTTRGRCVVASDGQTNGVLSAGEPWKLFEGVDIVVNMLSLQCLEQQSEETGIDSLVSLAHACDRAGVPIIQLSTSQVFDGLNSRRFKETDSVVSGTEVSAMLSRMEESLRGNCSRHIILRTGPLFSSAKENLLTNLLSRVSRGDSLSLSRLDNSCPMHAKDLARVVSAIIDQLGCGCESWGTYHYCSSDPVSSFLFAETVLGVAAQYTDADAHPLTLESSDATLTEWSRPVLNSDKIRNTFGIKQLPWRAFIVPTVKQYFDDNVSSMHKEP